MRLNKKICTASLTLLLTCLSGQASHAQTLKDVIEPSVGFKVGIKESNIDPFAYRGEPVNYGSFLLWPNLILEQVYNDNVLATGSDAQGDFATFLKPELIFKKDFGRHQLIGALNAEMQQYYDETSENIENYSVKLEADIEAKQGINIPIKFSYRDGHLSRIDQTRESANDIPNSPLGNQNLQIESGVVIKPNRFSLTLLGNYMQGRLENGELNNGTALIRDNRNVNRTTGTARLGYDYSETFTPFIEYNYAEEDYIDEITGAVSRNNNYNKVLAGSFFDYRGLITGALATGWIQRSYDSADVDDSDGLALQGRIAFNPTEKTQYGFQFSRDRIEDNVIIAGVKRDFAKLNLTHEITRNFFGRAGLSYENKDFEESTREDTLYTLDLGFNYIFSPRAQIGTEYKFVTRDSTLDSIEVDNSILFLRARFAL